MSTTTGHVWKTARVLGVAVLATAVVACGGSEQPEAMASDAVDAPAAMTDETAYGFDDIDMDGDSELDANEFHEWSETPTFAFYMQTDLVEDPTEPEHTGALDAVVLIDALYSAWDVDDDGALDRGEWAAATDVLTGLNDTEATWIEFDVDENDIIDVDEVHAQIEDDEVLAGIDADADGTVEEQELNEWFFALFDTDDDGRVSTEEWRMAEIYLDVPIL